MKTHIKKSIVTLSLILGAVLGLNAQVYSETLEEVFLKTNKADQIIEDSFITFQYELANTKELSFPKEIKKAKSSGEVLVFTTDKSNTELSKTIYLKAIRRAANRSEDPITFKLFLETKLPSLKNQLNENQLLFKLYNNSRKATFNGRLDVLAKVILPDQGYNF